MANLKVLKDRITSVTSTRKITKAMQMVAAAKLRRAQDAAAAARPYAERMDDVLTCVATGFINQGATHPLLTGTGKDDVHTLVVMTAERGLCGGFNSNIAKLARNDALRLLGEGKTVKIICVGSKGNDSLRRDLGKHIVDRVDMRGVKRLSITDAENIGSTLLELYEAGEFDVATIYYSEFKSVINQAPTALQLIPPKLPDDTDDKDEDNDAAAAAYIYEPDDEIVLNYLLKRNISTQLFRGLLENAASEQGARMTAMDNATRNAGDMIEKLTISYNRQRQAKITTELIEIISGAEAL